MEATRRRPPTAAATALSAALAIAALQIATVRADDEARCVFPFMYEGLRRDSCVSHEHSQPWCATTRNYDADRMWRNCRAEDMSGLPRMLPQASRIVTASGGDEVRLACVVQNLQQHAIVWTKRGEEHPLTIRNFVYTKDRRVSVENSTSIAEGISVWKLVIRDANQSDSGMYECRVPMRNILLHYDIQLSVAARVEEAVPAVTLGEARSRTVDKGAPFSLQCNATSTDDPSRRPMPPEVEWFKDGIKVNSVALSSVLITNQISGRFRISTLLVERSTMEDAGTYICRTSEQTFAEVKVHVLNVDKDNKKRGTAHEANDKGAHASHQVNAARWLRGDTLAIWHALFLAAFFKKNS